jgi:hypothetical protein
MHPGSEGLTNQVVNAFAADPICVYLNDASVRTLDPDPDIGAVR